MYYIQRRISANQWATLRGRRYKSRSAAQTAWDQLETKWNAQADAGSIHPEWRGRFNEMHRIIQSEGTRIYNH